MWAFRGKSERQVTKTRQFRGGFHSYHVTVRHPMWHADSLPFTPTERVHPVLNRLIQE